MSDHELLQFDGMDIDLKYAAFDGIWWALAGERWGAFAESRDPDDTFIIDRKKYTPMRNDDAHNGVMVGIDVAEDMINEICDTLKIISEIVAD